MVKAVASALKSEYPGTKIRIDTNGHANLFWGRNVLPELKGLINSISISLDTENAELYEKLCHPLFGKYSYSAILEFIKAAKQSIPEVEISVVDLPAVDKEKAKGIAEELGVGFRTRPYYENTYVR
jgi:TatD DNase family protein